MKRLLLYVSIFAGALSCLAGILLSVMYAESCLSFIGERISRTRFMQDDKSE